MITSTLIGATTPQLMQIVVTGIPVGEAWTVVGTAGEGFVWTVPGAVGVSDGGQITLVDNRYPPNQAVTYVVIYDSGKDESAPIIPLLSVDSMLEPPDGGAVVLSTLNGQKSVVVGLLAGSLDWNRTTNRQRYTVSGRSRPVVRYSVTGDRDGQLRLLQKQMDSVAFDAVFASGEPILVRCTRRMMGLPLVFVADYGDLSAVARQSIDMTVWSMPYAVIDDPYLDQRLGAFTWDYIDALQKVGSTVRRSGDVMEAIMAGRTWDEIDAFDWSVLA